jgi:ParB/RepB/Spo0J family partition protein
MTTFGMTRLDLIVPSLTNPRKTFNEASLKELAESIAAAGVHTPVLLRPLPAHRLEDTAHLSPRPEFELVAGERRYRASLLAHADSIPAMIRELTDDQALEVSIIENLQRDDLTALEEAQGYQMLMDHSQVTADQVAERIGKSRSYVFSRLKLLDMGQDCRDALRDGLIDASKALLLARIPSTALQVKALKEIIRTNHPEGVMSHRMAAEWIRSRYMLKIEQAPFDHTDTTLAPRACTICPTRTGADADLFMDVMGADMCTDPDCYAGKVQQHHSRRRAQLEAQGHQIIDGEDAKAVMPYAMGAPDGYARLDDAADSPTSKTLRQELAKMLDSGELVPVIIVNPHKENDLIACVPEEDVPALLERAGSKAAKAAAKAEKERRATHDQEDREAALRDEYETTWRERVLQAVVDGVRKEPEQDLTPTLRRRLANLLIDEMHKTTITSLCDMLDVDAVSDEEAGDASPHVVALFNWATDMGNGLTAGDTLTVLSAAGGAQWQRWMARSKSQGEEETAPLLDATIDLDVSVKAIQSQVKAEITARETAAADAANADLSLAPAAQANGVRGGKAKKAKRENPAGAAAHAQRLSAQEAEQGIAAAMQGMDDDSGDFAAVNSGADAQSNEHGADCRAVPWPHSPAPDDQPKGHQDRGIERSDVLLEDARELVTEMQAVSVRAIKAALNVGTTRAMRLIEQLERDGVVSACDERGARKVLVAE